MAAPKQEDTALAPPEPRSQLAQSATQNGLSRGERRVIDEYRTQAAVIDAQAAKTIYAERVYGQLTTYTHDVAVRTLSYIDQTHAQTQSPTIRALCEREKQQYMYQALEMVNTAGEALHREVGRPLYPEKRRLFGG